jgi:hypothetical protein
MFYSGIDLHKDMCVIAALNQEGHLINQQKLANDEYTILNYFFTIGKRHRVVVKSTFNWYWPNDLLNAHSIDMNLENAKY